MLKEVQRWRWALSASICLEDLVSAGHVGVETAKAKFNPELGEFSTYAMWWIRNEMRRCAERTGTVRVPAEARRLAFESGAPIPYQAGSLDDALCPPDAHPRAEELDAEGTIDLTRMKDELLEALGVLHPRSLQIVTLVHYRSRTFVEVAKMLGLTASRIRQLHREALNLLRAELE